MKKLIYVVFMITTIYLGIMYEWEESVWLLSAEIIFPFLCFGMAWSASRRMEWNIILQKDTAEQGERIPLKIRTWNKGGIPSVVQVACSYRYVSGSERKDVRTSVYVPAKKREQIEMNIPAKHCGKIRVSVSSIRIFDCWGLFSVRKKDKKNYEITIMPKPFPINLVVSNRTRWFPVDGESYAQDRGGDDTAEIYEIREYRAGDRMQKVHWKLSAKEDDLYIKEFSYPLGAAVILMLEEGIKEESMEQFMEAVVSVSTALLQGECPHYMIWQKKNEKELQRVLIRGEEEFHGFLLELLQFEKGCLERDIEEYYRHEYRSDTYSTLLKIRTDLTLQVNQDENMDMKKEGLEQFFEHAEIVV